MARLWDNFGGSFSDFGAASQEWQAGNHFTVTSMTPASEISWYRFTTSGPGPTRLQLWQVEGQILLYEDPAPPDNGSVGWQRRVMSSAVTLYPTQSYAVVMHQVVNQHYAYVASASKPTPPSPLAWTTPLRYSYQTTGFIFPTGTDNTNCPAFDIQVGTVAPGTTPPAPISNLDLATAVSDLENYIDVGNALILSMVSNEGTPSAYSIPNQIKTAINDASTGLGAIKGVVDTVATSVGTGLKTAVDAITTTLGGVSSGMVQTLNTVSSTVATILNDASAGLVAVLSRLAGGGGALPPVAPAPATGWSLRTSTTWQGELAWAEPADLYVIHVTTVPTKSNPQIVAGVQMYWRSGWWCILNGAETGQRYFLDFEWGEATWGGRRMPGILLYYGTGWEGTIDAWDYTAP